MPNPMNRLITVMLLILGFAGAVSAANREFDMGEADYHRSDWAGAITNFSKLIAVSFDLYDSYSYRAYSEAEKGQSNAAIADCDEVVKLNVNYSGGCFWRSRVELILTNDETALKDFETGLRLGTGSRPGDLASDLAFPYAHHASQEFWKGNLNASVTNLNVAIFIDPTNGPYHELRGWIRELQGHSGGAITDADAGIKFNHNPALAYLTRAFARCELKDASGALEDCKKVSEIYAGLSVGIEHPKRLASLGLDPLLVE